MQLVLPSSKYKESFIEALQEYQKENVSNRDSRFDLMSLSVVALQKDFDSYVQELMDASIGKGLPDGFIAHTTFWLVDENEFIGRVDIRHMLTEKLLKEGGHIGYDIRPSKRSHGYGKKILELVLPKVKALGIMKVLVTCNEDNIASKKIIEANGGVFENSVEIEKGKPRKLRYWITL